MFTMPLSVFTLFMEGGPGFMTVITLLFIAVLFCAWKFPKLVKLTGNMALAVSAFSTLLGFCQTADVIQIVGSMSQDVLWGGIKVCTIAPMYGLIVYMVSLVARAINEFRK